MDGLRRQFLTTGTKCSPTWDFRKETDVPANIKRHKCNKLLHHLAQSIVEVLD